MLQAEEQIIVAKKKLNFMFLNYSISNMLLILFNEGEATPKTLLWASKQNLWTQPKQWGHYWNLSCGFTPISLSLWVRHAGWTDCVSLSCGSQGLPGLQPAPCGLNKPLCVYPAVPTYAQLQTSSAFCIQSVPMRCHAEPCAFAPWQWQTKPTVVIILTWGEKNVYF